MAVHDDVDLIAQGFPCKGIGVLHVPGLARPDAGSLVLHVTVENVDVDLVRLGSGVESGPGRDHQQPAHRLT